MTETETTQPHPKIGVLLLNMGGPDRLEAVKPFLINLFSDPDIFKFPLSWLFQKPLAQLIVASRLEEATHNYLRIGGRSPILPLTLQQAEALQAELDKAGHQISVYLAFRYWHPFTEEALAIMEKDGVEQVVVLSLYPHFSYTTTGSSVNELRRIMARKKLNWPLTVIPPYPTHPDYLAALAETIEEGLNEHPWTCLQQDVTILFSAHSLPVSHVKRTADPYPDQIQACIQALMGEYFPDNPWDLAYQSKVGKMMWLGPPTDGVLSYYAGQKTDNVLVVAISFVTDHIETLCEIDLDYIVQAREMGLVHCYRSPALNNRPRFIRALANLVEAHLPDAAATGDGEPSAASASSSAPEIVPHD